MSLRNPATARGLVGVVALLATAVGLYVAGGPVSAAFAAGAAAVWLVLPPVFAFVVGQIGLAAVASEPVSSPVVGTQLALVGVLLSDDSVSTLRRSWGPALLFGAIAVTGVGLAWTYAPLIGTVTSLVAVAGLVYGTHRYQLLVTNQLDSQ